MVKSNDTLMRIDKELADMIRSYAQKNNINFRQASKEMAKLNKIKLSNRKIIKEIRF